MSGSKQQQTESTDNSQMSIRRNGLVQSFSQGSLNTFNLLSNKAFFICRAFNNNWRSVFGSLVQFCFIINNLDISTDLITVNSTMDVFSNDSSRNKAKNNGRKSKDEDSERSTKVGTVSKNYYPETR